MIDPAAQAERRGRRVSRYARVFAAIFLIASCMTSRAETPISPDVLRTPERATSIVSDGQQDIYRKVLAAYAQEESSHPGDVQLVLAHCRFIEGFATSEELPWTDVADEDFQRCKTDLQTRFPNDAEANLFLAQFHYGKNAFDFAHALLQASAHWTVLQRAKLHGILARAHTAMKQPDLAGQEALAAVQLDPASDQLVTALRYLCNTGRGSQAEALLAQAPIPHPIWSEWQRVQFAADNLSPAVALAELQRAKHAGMTADPWLEARIYLRAGKTADAAHVLACGCQGSSYETVEQYQTRLKLALATGDRKATSAALQGWLTKTGLSWPLLSAYGNALRHDPLQLFSPSLTSLALALLGAMLAALCLPGVVAFPAHYRGTVRARLSKPSTPLFERIGLRHMWIACAAYLVTTTAIPMFWGEGALHAWMTNKFLWPEDQTAIVMIQSMMAVAVSVLMLPAIARFTAREWLGDRGLKLALATIVVWTLAKVFLLWVATHTGHLSQATQATQHDRLITTLIQAATHVGGAPLAMLIVAVLAPIYEELIFRGCVLGGLSRHISFGWANVWQGTLFALIHNDMRHFVFYFLMGVLSGWLVRRTRGLAASIGLHMANNAVACVAVLLMHP
jgi:hypothetical protein